jgi:hypothetical protein
MRRKYHGGNSASLPLLETVGPFPPGFTRHLSENSVVNPAPFLVVLLATENVRTDAKVLRETGMVCAQMGRGALSADSAWVWQGGI